MRLRHFRSRQTAFIEFLFLEPERSVQRTGLMYGATVALKGCWFAQRQQIGLIQSLGTHRASRSLSTVFRLRRLRRTVPEKGSARVSRSTARPERWQVEPPLFSIPCREAPSPFFFPATPQSDQHIHHVSPRHRGRDAPETAAPCEEGGPCACCFSAAAQACVRVSVCDRAQACLWGKKTPPNWSLF